MRRTVATCAKSIVTVGLVLVVFGAASNGAAQEPVYAKAYADNAAADAPTDAKRPVPDYDGRGPEPTTAGDIAIWVPRLVLSPLWLVTNFVVRKPLGALIGTAEREQWPSKLIDFFTFNDAHTIGIVPIGLFDFGFRPSVGAMFFWDQFLANWNDFEAHATTGGSNWFAFSVRDSMRLGKNANLGLEVLWIDRPDYIFAGIGPLSRQSRISRYGFEKLETGPRFDARLAWWLQLRGRVGYKNEHLRDGHFGHDPSLSEAVDRGWYETPAAFPAGENIVYEELGVVLDSRHPEATNFSGVRFYGHGREFNDWRGASNQWVRYGADIAGFWDIAGRHRILELEVQVELADPLQRGRDIPFFELVTWGGPTNLEGYRPGRLVGRSAAAATLSYQWPIWVWLNGTIQASLGNVFDAAFHGFRWGLLRASGAVGVQSNGPPDRRFEMTVGLGSEAFAVGGAITSFRLTFGATNGF